MLSEESGLISLPAWGRSQPQFILQWHLTAQCEAACSHCYMKGSSSYAEELKNELSLGERFEVINDFARFIQNFNIKGRINFTGGNPLLCEDFFKIVDYASDKEDIDIGVLGNPYGLDEKTVRTMKRSGVIRYQVSMDGLEDVHDTLRGRGGSFKETVKAIKMLESEGIPSVVMFTLSKRNADELIPVIHKVAEIGASIFDFSRLVPIGLGKNYSTQMLDPFEYRNLLLEVLETYRKLENSGCHTHFGRKENLWNLLYKELGLLRSLPDEGTVYSGCGIGWKILTILADGTVYPCRRLPMRIGRVPEESLSDIFFENDNEKFNDMGEVFSNFEKCSECNLVQVCRGCPAIPYSLTGDPFAPDPQCWREI